MKRIYKPEKLEAEKSGFTLIELSLAMAFIALLLIAIAIVTINIIAIFQKGSTIKAVNSVGRSLIDDFTSSINSAAAIDTISLCNSLLNDDLARNNCIADHARKFIFNANYDDDGRQLNGVFCTGSYSYIWNTYYGLESDHSITVHYITNIGTPADNNKNFRLMKVKDRNFRVCTSLINDKYQLKTEVSADSKRNYFTQNKSQLNLSISEDGTFTGVPELEIDALLRGFDTDLALYELTVFPMNQDVVTLRTYMSGTFILATTRGNVDVTTTGDYCTIDGDISTLATDFNYCAINKFNFAARTAGSVGV